jgi:phosphatidylglycerol---prolipoprotein diacylglyceryl transferase
MRPVLIQIPFPWYHFTGDGGFYVAHLPLFSYGMMLGLSLIVGWYVVLALCDRSGIDREKAGRLYVLTAMASVAGARLLYVLTNLGEFRNPLRIFYLWDGGLVAYGGFLAGFLTAVVVSRRFNFRLLNWADCVVPSLGTGLLFTRIGCLLAGCDYGAPVEAGSVASKWAIQFPARAAATIAQRNDGLLPPDAVLSLPVHPTQIYESLIGLTLFGITMLVYRYRKFTGQMFCAFTIGYGVLRFLVEFLRADKERGELGGLSTSQFLGLTTSLAAAGLLVWLYRRWQRDPDAARYWEQVPVTVPAEAATARPRRRRRRK